MKNEVTAKNQQLINEGIRKHFSQVQVTLTEVMTNREFLSIAEWAK